MQFIIVSHSVRLIVQQAHNAVMKFCAVIIC